MKKNNMLLMIGLLGISLSVSGVAHGSTQSNATNKTSIPSSACRKVIAKNCDNGIIVNDNGHNESSYVKSKHKNGF